MMRMKDSISNGTCYSVSLKIIFGCIVLKLNHLNENNKNKNIDGNNFEEIRNLLIKIFMVKIYYSINLNARKLRLANEEEFILLYNYF